MGKVTKQLTVFKQSSMHILYYIEVFASDQYCKSVLTLHCY